MRIMRIKASDSCAVDGSIGKVQFSQFMQKGGGGVLGLTSLYMTKMISDNYNRVANSS